MSQAECHRCKQKEYGSLYLSLSHLGVPLLRELFRSLKRRASWHGAGRGASKEMFWVLNITQYFWWDSCDQNLLWVWAMLTSQQIQASTWPGLSFQSLAANRKAGQIEQESPGLLSATLLHSGKNTPVQRPQELVNPGKNLFKLSDYT